MTSELLKRCRCCGEWKPFSAFYRHPETRDRRMNACVTCYLGVRRDAAARRRQAGPVPADHVCPICQELSVASGYTDWHLDHNHKTGVIRAYLCRGCNINMDRYVGDHPLAEATSRYLALYESAHTWRIAA